MHGAVGPTLSAYWNHLGFFINTDACVPPRDYDLIGLWYGLGFGMFKKFLGDSNLQPYLVNNGVEAVSQPKHGRKNYF